MILADGKIKLAFYRSRYGNSIDGAINVFSGSGGFSHCEIVFPDGMSFSSTTRDASIDPRTGKDKPDGTRFKQIEFDPDKWAVAELSLADRASPAVESEIAAMRGHAAAILPARYDYAGVFRFISLIGLGFRQSPDKYFCSEAVIEVAQAAKFLLDFEPALTSPNRLAQKLGIK